MQNSGLKHPGKRLPTWKRLLFPLLLPALLACTLIPTQVPVIPTAPATATATLLPTAPPPISELGSSKAPLILALPPSGALTSQVQTAGKTLVGLLEKATNYHIVSVLPPSESDLVQGFANGNAHIGVLSPFAYLLASEQGSVEAVFAREHVKEIFYGAQFVARANTGFTSYFDPIVQANSAEAPVALSQFQDKKPCWTDNLSPSGYIVPLGYLKQAQIATRPPAFLAGHVAVVRAVYVGGICDFGATYIDARSYPGLEDQYPDLLKQVNVIWRIPPIIPYESLVFFHGMNEDMRRNLTRAFVDVESTPEGQSVMQTLYGFEGMQVVQDAQYDAFRKAVKASGVDLTALVK